MHSKNSQRIPESTELTHHTLSSLTLNVHISRTFEELPRVPEKRRNHLEIYMCVVVYIYTGDLLE